MCGILGGINTGFGSAHLERLRHRGPDQQSLVTEPIGDGLTLTLGQTRLAVVDRHPIALPVRVRARDGRQASILFNGEIYNWPELRVELETLGWSFATSTDT